MHDMFTGAVSHVSETRAQRVHQVRLLLAMDDPPVQQVVGSGVIKRFVEFLSTHENPDLQIDALWVLNQIVAAASKHTKMVMDMGAIPVCVHLLSSPNDVVREQATAVLANFAVDSAAVVAETGAIPVLVHLLASPNDGARDSATCALGNIAIGSPYCRDLVLQAGAMDPLLRQLNAHSELTALRAATRTLHNCCQGKPEPNFEFVRPALPSLAQLLFSPDEEVLVDACWTLSYLSRGSNEKIQAVIDSGVCHQLIKLLPHSSPAVQTPVLRVVGNIVKGNDSQTQFITGAIPACAHLFSSPNEDVREEAAVVLGNIALYSAAVVAEMGAIPALVHLQASTNHGVRDIAMCALGNIASDSPHCRDLVLQAGAMNPLLGELNAHSELTTLRTATWMLRNCCEGKPEPNFDFIRPALPSLAQLLFSHDEEVLVDACSALYNLSRGSNEKIQAVIDIGICHQLVKLLLNSSPTVQKPALFTVRNILTENDTQRQIITGAIPACVHLLSSPNEDVRAEAAVVLGNIALYSATVVAEMGAIPALVHLQASPDHVVRHSAMYALGNIASDSPHCRDLVLQAGAMNPLSGELNAHSELTTLRTATWMLRNCCEGNPEPNFDFIRPALPSLAQLLFSHDEEVLVDACSALYNLSRGSNEKIQAVIDSGICHQLVKLLLNLSPAVQKPALFTVRNILTRNDPQTHITIINNVLPCLLTLLSSPNEGVRKNTCWVIFKITAGNEEQLQEVIDHNIIPPLIQLLTDAKFDIRKGAAWAISKATCNGTWAQIQFLVQQ
jgi:HEAT repeat protein